MARRDDDARIRLEMRRQEFHGRSRRKTDIDDIDSGKAANACDILHNRLPRRAAIATNHHAFRLRDFEESPHMALQNLRGKSIAHDSANTRNRTHQFRHRFSPIN